MSAADPRTRGPETGTGDSGVHPEDVNDAVEVAQALFRGACR